MPAPVAACWTHLTDPERALCKAARSRRNQERRERNEQMRADLAAQGKSPEPAYREERPCIGRCITRAALRDQQGSGYYDHSDSDVIGCAYCDETVCLLCRDRNHSFGTPCTSPSTVEGDELPWAGGEEIDHGPNPREHLNLLVAQLARVTGDRHATINARINRAIGVPSRVGAEEAVIRRAAAVARDWLTAEQKDSAVEADRRT
ncbi:hypothetical protein [Streptomyces canus]|uniref:hypothetical protein n=1 Tax=Streptomyces canus TaxID=58343 RepID=UPI002E272890